MIKRYRSTCDDSGIEVVLDVDHDVLTPELAREINAFWTDADWRLECAGDIDSTAITVVEVPRA